MLMGLTVSATPICAFSLGCIAIYTGRAHAAALTRLLIFIAAVAGVLVVIKAAVIWAPDDRERFDEITVYAAYAGHPQGAE